MQKNRESNRAELIRTAAAELMDGTEADLLLAAASYCQRGFIERDYRDFVSRMVAKSKNGERLSHTELAGVARCVAYVDVLDGESDGDEA